jgi:undecaprenyl diphosphate synthase
MAHSEYWRGCKLIKAKSTKTKHEPATREEPFPLEHVAIIMDGNRRWADSRRLPRLMGHKEGVKTLKDLVKYVSPNGLKYLTVYAFSSENWARSVEEVNYLLELFANVLRDELDELHQNNVRLRFLGQLATMPVHLRESFQRSMDRTKANTGLSLQVAINYGSRMEITEAVKAMIIDVEQGKLAPRAIDEQVVSNYLYTSELPDPDLIIRTGGEMRLSNYLLWQAAYAELYVTPVLWPEFTPAEFEKAIKEFTSRDRRYGS